MTHTEIKAQLSSRQKWSNAQEWRPINTATAEGITIEGDGPLMDKLAMALIGAEYSPFCLLSAYRGDMECLKPQTLSKWASGTAGRGEQPKHLRRGQR